MEMFIMRNILFAMLLSFSASAFAEQTEETTVDESFRDMQGSDSVGLVWWSQRLIDYEKLINEWLELNKLEETKPDQPETVKARSDLNAFLDFYLMDYWVIQNQIDNYRERVVDLERQINEICPGQSIRGRVRCRDKKREQIQELRQAIFEEKHANSYRILRTVLPLLSFRKSQLEMTLETTEEPSLASKILFDLMEINKDRDYGLCSASLSWNEYDVFQSPPCQFIFLYTISRIINLNQERSDQLEELYQTLDLE